MALSSQKLGYIIIKFSVGHFTHIYQLNKCQLWSRFPVRNCTVGEQKKLEQK
jgi:hypothetical protein